MEREQKGHNNFLLGLIVGSVLTLLFTTKKGRKILKTIVDEGLDKYSGWKDIVNETFDEYDADNLEGEDYIEEPLELKKEQVKNYKEEETADNVEVKHVEEEVSVGSPSVEEIVAKVKPVAHRFFKRTSKKN